MANKSKSKKGAVTPSTTEVATAADSAAASAQPPSVRKTPMTALSTKLVNTYATPALQEGLLALQSPLANFSGCGDVKTTLSLATEGEALAGSFARLQDAANRVGQRVVEINAELKALDTALSRAQTAAPQGSVVQKGLKTLSALRKTGIVAAKRKRTKNTNQKKKGATKG